MGTSTNKENKNSITGTMTMLRVVSRNIIAAANRNNNLLALTKNSSPNTLTKPTAIRSMGSSGDHDHHHEHLVFEPPYNPYVIGGWLVFVVGGGFGSMVWAFRHQQYKQGFWK